jgi:hypothetical protein
MAERLMPDKLPVGRNTLLLSAGMAALYGMVQLWAAVTPITFEAVTGLEGLVGLGPAIFMSTAALAALPLADVLELRDVENDRVAAARSAASEAARVPRTRSRSGWVPHLLQPSRSSTVG